MNEQKSVFEYKAAITGTLKDVDKGSRTMVGMFANYQTPDASGDVSFKGMFDKTWKENKNRVKLLYEHDTTKVPGKVQDLWDDEKGAYHKSIAGKHKFGEDVLDMADAGLINEHSFGYITKKATKNAHGGRDLKEVMHLEVTLIGGDWAMHGNTPMLSVTKAMEVQTVIEKMEQRYKSLDAFCRNSNASDETIELLLLEIKQLQQNIIDLSATSTPAAEEALEPQKGYTDNEVIQLYAALQTTNIKIKSI